jgi:chemotaxis protein CheD
MPFAALAALRVEGREPRVQRLDPGAFHVGSDPEEVIVTILGSCVAACICDPVARVGGMNHFMLPASADGVWGKASASLRYGNFAMEKLVNELLMHGARRDRLEVKLFGGAQLGPDSASIGARNARFAEDYLRDEGMAVRVSEMRGNRGRRVLYRPVDGRAFVRELPVVAPGITGVEDRLRQRLTRLPSGGSVELFD